MNSFPCRDAASLSEAANQLALSTRSFDDPLDPYYILGDLLASLREVHQVIVQIADWHRTHAKHALHDHGCNQDGANAAHEAAQALLRATLQIGRTCDAIDTASGITSHLIWHIPTNQRM